jgi:hypothetical protein
MRRIDCWHPWSITGENQERLYQILLLIAPFFFVMTSGDCGIHRCHLRLRGATPHAIGRLNFRENESGVSSYLDIYFCCGLWLMYSFQNCEMQLLHLGVIGELSVMRITSER